MAVDINLLATQTITMNWREITERAWEIGVLAEKMRLAAGEIKEHERRFLTARERRAASRKLTPCVQ